MMMVRPLGQGKVYSSQVGSNLYPMAFVGTQNAVVFSETLRENPQATVGVFRINLLLVNDLKAVQIPIRLE